LHAVIKACGKRGGSWGGRRRVKKKQRHTNYLTLGRKRRKKPLFPQTLVC
jgi:hypothetical protein